VSVRTLLICIEVKVKVKRKNGKHIQPKKMNEMIEEEERKKKKRVDTSCKESEFEPGRGMSLYRE